MAKTIKDSTKRAAKAKSVEKNKELYAYPGGREMRWYSENEVRAISERMLLYFKTNPKAIKINQFLGKEDIYRNTWDRWAEKYEWLREMKEQMFLLIANRREEGMVFLEDGQRETANLKVMHRYDPEWIEIDRYHAELKAAAAQKALEATGGGAVVTRIVTVEVDRVKVAEPIKDLQVVEAER